MVYRKMWLGGAEPRRFTAGDHPAAVDVDGWRVGLGICKDTAIASQIEQTVALGVDLYAAGVTHRPEELSMQEQRALTIAYISGAYVAFASFAGPTGGGFDMTAASSAIWSPEGHQLANAGVDVGATTSATLK